MLQRTTRLVHHDRCFAVRVLDRWRNGFLALRVANFIGVAKHQRLAIGQAHGHQRVPWLVFTNGGHGDAGRKQANRRA